MGKSIVNKVEDLGYRVEKFGNQYTVYKYEEDYNAYVFYCKCNSKQELKEVIKK